MHCYSLTLIKGKVLDPEHSLKIDLISIFWEHRANLNGCIRQRNEGVVLSWLYIGASSSKCWARVGKGCEYHDILPFSLPQPPPPSNVHWRVGRDQFEAK